MSRRPRLDVEEDDERAADVLAELAPRWVERLYDPHLVADIVLIIMEPRRIGWQGLR